MTMNMLIPADDDPRWTRRDGVFVPREEGVTKWVSGETTTVKLTASQTNGAFGLLEINVPPGGGPVAHAHGREDEAFYVLSGDFEFLNGDQTIDAGPGDFMYVPRGNRHRFTNRGRLPATLLTFLFPGGHEQFWLDNGMDPVPGEVSPPWGPDKLGALAEELARYQVTFLPEPPR